MQIIYNANRKSCLFWGTQSWCLFEKQLFKHLTNCWKGENLIQNNYEVSNKNPETFYIISFSYLFNKSTNKLFYYRFEVELSLVFNSISDQFEISIIPRRAFSRITCFCYCKKITGRARRRCRALELFCKSPPLFSLSVFFVKALFHTWKILLRFQC